MYIIFEVKALIINRSIKYKQKNFYSPSFTYTQEKPISSWVYNYTPHMNVSVISHFKGKSE